MVRGRVEVKRIENATSRQVTFSKRRNGLLKKAYELSILCDAEVAVIIFSQKGRLFEFASSNMQETIARYLEHTKEEQITDVGTEHQIQHLKNEVAQMAKKKDFLENSQRKLLGQNLGTCSAGELQEIDNQLQKSLTNIRARKDQLLKEEIGKLKAKETFLIEENARLYEKCGLKQKHTTEDQKETASCSQSTMSSEVVTDLFIGLAPVQNGY